MTVRRILKSGESKTYVYGYSRKNKGCRLSAEDRARLAEHSKTHIVEDTACAFSVSKRTVQRIRRALGLRAEKAPLLDNTTYIGVRKWTARRQ